MRCISRCTNDRKQTMWGEKQLFWRIDTPPFFTSGAPLRSCDMGSVDIGFCLLSLRGAGNVAERTHERNVHPVRQENMTLSGHFRGIFGVFLCRYVCAM